MSHWDAVNNKRDTVALAIFAYGDSAENYIPFTAPVNSTYAGNGS
jgi:hypothetical protein